MASLAVCIWQLPYNALRWTLSRSIRKNMLSFTINICVFTLVLLALQHTCHSRPQSKDKTEIEKDYLNPYIMDPDQFEKGEDGKQYLKKSAHKLDSEVKYFTSENLEDKNGIVQSNLKDSEVKIVRDEDEKNEPVKEMIDEIAFSDEVSSSPNVEEVLIIKELPFTQSRPILEETARKVEVDKGKAPFAPIDPKFVVPPKPDSKDEIALKTDLSPTEEEKVDEKVAIGQVPDLYPRVISVPNNFRLPIFIPFRQVSYGAASVLPFPPADASDRLPMSFEDDIVGEGGHESDSVEDPESSVERKEEAEFHQGIGIRLPVISFSGLMKNLKDADKPEEEKQTKVVDVLGKKFLMQSNVMKFPHGDNGNTYVRFMSVKPLVNVVPTIKTETADEEAIGKGIGEAKNRVVEEDLKKEFVAKEEILKEDESFEKFDESKAEKEKGLSKEPEILKAEETLIKFELDPHVPKEIAFRESPEIKEVADHGMTEMKEIDGMIKSFRGDLENKNLERKFNSEKKAESEEVESMEDKIISEKGSESIDSLLKREDVKKETDIVNAKELFLVEKKKKGMVAEEPEGKTILKKNSEKKKKCKCEEKDSDSDEE